MSPVVVAQQAEKIGYVYVIRGTLEGKAVVYTGSTMRELVDRLYKDPHTWKALAQSKSTTIEFYEITAALNIAESGRKTLQSATQEALRSAEQVAMKRERSAAAVEGIGRRELNVPAAATEPNIDKWGETHSVRIGPRKAFGAGVKIGGFAALQILDFFLMYRDSKLAQYATAPYLLEDEGGVYAIQEIDRGPFRRNWYYKNYKAGPLAGQRVQIPKDEFNRLAEVAEILWGTTDWMGDFVPGILRRELPVVEEPLTGTAATA